jgi:hypothetical protein
MLPKPQRCSEAWWVINTHKSKETRAEAKVSFLVVVAPFSIKTKCDQFTHCDQFWKLTSLQNTMMIQRTSFESESCFLPSLPKRIKQGSSVYLDAILGRRRD